MIYVDIKTVVVVLAIALLSAWVLLGGNSSSQVSGGEKITLYKNPNCGCCVSYAEELRKARYNVDVIEVEDMESVKAKYWIAVEDQLS